MKEEQILKMARTRVYGQMMTYEDFDDVFGKLLPKRMQYQVVDLLSAHGIELVDKLPETQEEDLVLSEEKQKEVNQDWAVEDGAVGADARPFEEDTIVEREWHLPVPRMSNEMLCQLIQQGDRRARQDILVVNRRLVLKYVQYYRRSPWCNLTAEDLEQIGLVGLLKAAEHFDSHLGYAFSTYAVWWIRQCMTRAMMDEGSMIRVPVHMQEFVHKVTRLDFNLARQGVTDAAVRRERMAEQLEEPLEKIQYAFNVRDCFLRFVSLDTPVGEDKETPLEAFIEDDASPSVEEQVLAEDEKQILLDHMKQMKPREAKVLSLRFGFETGAPMTLEEVGRVLGVTRERIRQIESKAIRRMRSHIIRSGNYKSLKYEDYDEPSKKPERKTAKAAQHA